MERAVAKAVESTGGLARKALSCGFYNLGAISLKRMQSSALVKSGLETGPTSEALTLSRFRGRRHGGDKTAVVQADAKRRLRSKPS